MKKQALLFILLAVVAAGMIACGGDDKTELSWTNKTGDQRVEDIKWVPSNGNSDTSFSKVLTNDNDRTETKEISDNSRDGYGYASLNYNAPAQIVDTDGESNFTLASGQTNNYEIASCK